MTTLTILQTFKLLEEVQLPATFDKIVEVSGQDATDVALNLKLNMEHLDVDDRTSGAGTIYSLKYPDSYANSLLSQGKLIEYRVSEQEIDPLVPENRYKHDLVIRNVNRWIDFDFDYDDFNVYNNTEYQAKGFYNLGMIEDFEDPNVAVIMLGTSSLSEPFTKNNNGMATVQIRLEVTFDSLAHFGIIFKDHVKMQEELWTDLPGSLF